MRLQRSDDVDEAYAGVYAGAERLVDVYGLQFKQTPMPTSLRRSAIKESRRFVRNDMLLLVAGEAGPCFEAISTYVEAFIAR